MSSSAGALRRLDESGIPLLVARGILGGVMIYMSIPKMQDPAVFLKVINEYNLVPQGWYAVMNLISVIVPWIELLGGLALVLGIAIRGTAALLTVMLIGFTSAIFLRTLTFMEQGQPFFSVKFDCGCGTGEEIIWQKLLMNLGLILTGIVALVSQSRRFCLSAYLKPRRSYHSDMAAVPTD